MEKILAQDYIYSSSGTNAVDKINKNFQELQSALSLFEGGQITQQDVLNIIANLGLDDKYAQLDGGNTFSGKQVINGNVGIGESNPAYKVTANSIDTFTSFYTGGLGIFLNNENNTNGHGALSFVKGNSNVNAFTARCYNDTTGLNIINYGTGYAIKSQGKVKMSSLPSSPTGLSSGELWHNNGVLNIIP